MLDVFTSMIVALVNVPIMLAGAVVVPFVMLINNFLSRWTSRSLTDKDVVLVTGCDSGFGLAMVQRLLNSHDCKVIATLLDDSTPLAGKLRKEGVECVRLDFCQPDTLDQAVGVVHRVVKESGGRLHAVVNNAGVCVMAELDWMTPEQINRIMTINSTGPVLLVRALMERILQDQARLVFVTSIAGHTAWPYFSLYSMSKAALEQFVKCLRTELAPRDVPVLVVRPGNFTAATEIMAKQDTLAKEMWNAMDERKKRRHGDFWHITRVIRQAQQLTAEKDVSRVIASLEETLVARYPPTVIEVSSWSVSTLQLLSLIIPTSWVYPAFNHAVTAYLAITKVIFGEDNSTPFAADS